MDSLSASDIPERIVTQRLVLLRPKREDAKLILVAAEESLTELARWQAWAQEMPSLAAVETHIARTRASWELKESHLFHLFTHNDRFLGTCGLEKIDWQIGAFEIGYWLRTSAVGNGYMSEAVSALEREVFERLGGKCVSIKCDALNDRSAAIPKRLGYRLDGVLRCERVDPLGNAQDTMVWSKTREEYFEQPLG